MWVSEWLKTWRKEGGVGEKKEVREGMGARTPILDAQPHPC